MLVRSPSITILGPSESQAITTPAVATARMSGSRTSHITQPAATRTSGQPRNVLYSAEPVESRADSGEPSTDSGEIAVQLARSAEKKYALNTPLGTLPGPLNWNHSGITSAVPAT